MWYFRYLRGAVDHENPDFGSKNSNPDFYTIWENRSWNIGKSWKKLKKVEKWPKNHYLATLGIYLQFHDFQSFSKKITEKILTAWCYNWWSQYVRKFNYFLNNIPKIILGGGKTVKKFEKTLFFLFFGGFFLMKHQREAPPPWVGDEWIFGVHICNPIPFLNTSVPFFSKIEQKLTKPWFFFFKFHSP